MTTDIPSAVHAIAVNIGAAVTDRSTCCEVCGCLRFTWETCPNCAIHNVNNKEIPA